MEKIKTILNSTNGVLFLNVIIAILIYFILMSNYIVSISLMALFVIIALVADHYNLINFIFDSYIEHKKIALISALILLIILPISLTSYNYIAHIGTLAVIYAIACLGLNIQMGSARMTNFAPAAFMGVGAYSVGVCTLKFGLSPWIGMLLGIFLSGIFGLFVGLTTLNTKGYYLSLVTTAIQVAFTQLLITIHYLGGSDGMNNITKYSIFGVKLFKKYTIGNIKFAAQIPHMIFCILVLVLITYIVQRIYFCKHGFSLNIISQDEIAAHCFGIDVPRQKLFAFISGGMIMGLAGTLQVGLEGYVGPDNYNFNKSLMLICMVILGGIDNPMGVISGAFLLTIISEKLRDFSDYQQLVYGIVLVTMLLIRPNGIIPKRIRNYCAIAKRQPIRRFPIEKNSTSIDKALK